VISNLLRDGAARRANTFVRLGRPGRRFGSAH
jgi:hypothetical protein